ncbi:MAG: hypothetical protein ABI613_02035 [Gemmatimonadota bacterium]
MAMSKYRWTTQRMDLLERAVRENRRVSLMRRGDEFIVIALRIASVKQRDALIGRLPMTGEELTFVLDDLEGFQIVG